MFCLVPLRVFLFLPLEQGAGTVTRPGVPQPALGVTQLVVAESAWSPGPAQRAIAAMRSDSAPVKRSGVHAVSEQPCHYSVVINLHLTIN